MIRDGNIVLLFLYMRKSDIKVETRMKNERKRHGWNQQTLGVYAGVSAADVSRIESGRLMPYPGQAERLAEVLGLAANELQQPVAVMTEVVTA
jgi:transcriptional regulator with XRE-family HTH domain